MYKHRQSMIRTIKMSQERDIVPAIVLGVVHSTQGSDECSVYPHCQCAEIVGVNNDTKSFFEGFMITPNAPKKNFHPP